MQAVLKVNESSEGLEYEPTFIMRVSLPQARYNEFKEDFKALASKYDQNAVIDVSRGVKP